MSEPNYKAMYEDLKRELGIHASHDHDRTVRYARNMVDRSNGARQIIELTNGFARKVNEVTERMP